MRVGDVSSLWNDIVVPSNNTDIRNVNLFINSPGGDVFSGLALADQIERAKRKGFHITAHVTGIVAGAAVPVFAICEHRFAASGTILWFMRPPFGSARDVKRPQIFDLKTNSWNLYALLSPVPHSVVRNKRNLN